MAAFPRHVAANVPVFLVFLPSQTLSLTSGQCRPWKNVELLLYFFAQKHRDIKLHHNYFVLNETKPFFTDLFSCRWKRLEKVHIELIYDSIQTGWLETARKWMIYGESAHYASFELSFSLTDISPSQLCRFSIDPYTNSCLFTTNTHTYPHKKHMRSWPG